MTATQAPTPERKRTNAPGSVAVKRMDNPARYQPMSASPSGPRSFVVAGVRAPSRAKLNLGVAAHPNEPLRCAIIPTPPQLYVAPPPTASVKRGGERVLVGVSTAGSRFWSTLRADRA